MYLSEKTGLLGGATASDKARVTQWLMRQMAGLGPMLGPLGYFVKFAGQDIHDPRSRDRYTTEAKRLLDVLSGTLADRDWIAGGFSIADIAIARWLAIRAESEAWQPRPFRGRQARGRARRSEIVISWVVL